MRAGRVQQLYSLSRALLKPSLRALTESFSCKRDFNYRILIGVPMFSETGGRVENRTDPLCAGLQCGLVSPARRHCLRGRGRLGACPAAVKSEPGR